MTVGTWSRRGLAGGDPRRYTRHDRTIIPRHRYWQNRYFALFRITIRTHGTSGISRRGSKVCLTGKVCQTRSETDAEATESVRLRHAGPRLPSRPGMRSHSAMSCATFLQRPTGPLARWPTTAADTKACDARQPIAGSHRRAISARDSADGVTADAARDTTSLNSGGAITTARPIDPARERCENDLMASVSTSRPAAPRGATAIPRRAHQSRRSSPTPRRPARESPAPPPS